jgi:hypothetical protein
MDKHFGGLIWTNHALNRLRERGIKQGDAWATWRNPQQTKKGSTPGSWVYFRNYGSIQIEVVAKQNDKREWLILSVWSRPVFQSHQKSPSLWSILFKKIFS